MSITKKQESYLVNLVNKATGNSYRFLSQVREDGIGKRAGKVRGLSSSEASELIDEWEAKAKKAEKSEARDAAIEKIRDQDSLRLFSVSDCDPDPYEIYGWWEAVWAPTEDEALAWAKENYGGECPKGQDPGIRVVSVMDQNMRSKPEQAEVHRERRMSVLRDAGWREEGESACDGCGLYAIGYSEYRVCGECYLCPECRADEPDDPCEACSSIIGTTQKMF